MSETLTNGVIVPDKGSRDWYADLRSNWLKLDSLMAGGNITINPAQTDGILVATITVGGKEYKLYQQDGDVSVKIDPSTENAEYPLVASTSAEAITGSVVMAPAVTVNPSSGAVTATSFKGKLEGNASTATTATKAVQDGAGAVIADTYATKSELNAKANDDNVVHKSGTETIVGTKTFSNVTFADNAWFNGTSYLKFTKLESNTTTPTTDQYKHISVIANDGSQIGNLQFTKRADGSFDTTIYSHGGSSGDSNNGTLRITSNNEVHPINNKTKLGISGFKWSEVWAKTFNGNLVGNASTATTATKAVQDGTGAVIADTYATKSELNAKANQIMLAKNLTGANITPGGVVDCGNGNGKLKQWYLNADGTFLLSDTLPTGIWKSTSFVTLAPNEGGIFIKLS